VVILGHRYKKKGILQLIESIHHQLTKFKITYRISIDIDHIATLMTSITKKNSKHDYSKTASPPPSSPAQRQHSH
jgi:hypothetical protein